jgi:hypothetical protein
MNVQPKDTSRGHFYVSLVKSVFRLGAGTALVLAGSGWLAVAGVFIVIAEILGIVEELV